MTSKDTTRIQLPSDPAYEGTIEGNVQPDGSARVKLTRSGSLFRFQPGNYLAIVETAPQGRKEVVLWARPTNPPADGVLAVVLTPAKGLKSGNRVSLYWPKVDEPLTAVEPKPELATLRRLPVPPIGRSAQNVQRIANAVIGFHNEYKYLPPAVMRGPDGTPWHSWRVLILPYLGHQQLYSEYKLTEPWDSPNNRKLLSKMPDVYRDAAFGEPRDADERTYAHYAVVTNESNSFPGNVSPQCAFPTEGVKFQNPAALDRKDPGLRNLAIVRDSRQMSPLVGAVGPQAKIPWTKPQDLELTAMFPALGKPGSFATPYEGEGRQLAALGCFDGSLHLIPRDLKPATLRNLLTVTDGVLISEQEIPRIQSGGVKPKWWLTIEKSVATLECDVGTEMAQPVARTATTAP